MSHARLDKISWLAYIQAGLRIEDKYSLNVVK